MKATPVVIDPFSRLGDEIAGETADEVAINLGRTLLFNSRQANLLHDAPDLRAIFAGHKLSHDAKVALRKAEEVFDEATAKKERYARGS